MTSFNISNNNFAELIAENHNDPQWFNMLQSVLNYKAHLAQNEQRKNTINKKQVLNDLIWNYKLHTINGQQFIRVAHLTEVLLKGKLSQGDMYNNCMVSLNKLVTWICEQDTTKIKKGYLRKYD